MYKLRDNHGRIINYVRLAVTDRCNLRCFYCMPESGINYLPRKELLTYEEMNRLISLLAKMGITKIRITGGEPFVRKDMIGFLQSLIKIPQLQQVHLTTNGILTAPIVPALKKMGIASVNLSLDSIDKERFFKITRRDELNKVLQTFEQLLVHGIPTKINTVVIKGKNIADIISMALLTKKHPIEVRFIEEMPFNGSGSNYPSLEWNHKRILSHLKDTFPTIYKIPSPSNATATRYHIPNHKGTIGIIAAFSRTFCGTCNRIRITPQGVLKTCLYDRGVFNIKQIIRSGATDGQLKDTILEALNTRAKDGFEAEQKRNGLQITESMSSIGG